MKHGGWKYLAITILTLSGMLVIDACSLLGKPPDNSYLTPIPPATIDAFEFGNPIKTKVDAVIAAKKWGMSFHMNFPVDPMVIFVEQMSYSEAKSRIETTGTPNFDPNSPDEMVWFVVFKGDYTLTLPEGTMSLLRSGCEHVIVKAVDGMPTESGARSCDG